MGILTCLGRDFNSPRLQKSDILVQPWHRRQQYLPRRRAAGAPGCISWSYCPSGPSCPHALSGKLNKFCLCWGLYFQDPKIQTKKNHGVTWGKSKLWNRNRTCSNKLNLSNHWEKRKSKQKTSIPNKPPHQKDEKTDSLRFEKNIR